MKTRVIILLSLLMCLLFAVSVSAAVVDSGVCGDNLTWTFDDEGTLIISGEGEMSSPTWHKNIATRHNIEKVIIEEGTTNISTSAFSMCHNIESISLPSTLKSIDSRAFEYCTYLSEISIPDGVTAIESSAFSECRHLENVLIPESMLKIGSYAFVDCVRLERITIPKSVQEIGEGVFHGCETLKEVTLPFIGSKRGISGTPDAVFGYIFGYDVFGSNYMPGRTLQYYNMQGDYGLYYIPESLKTITITDETVIPYGAFYNCQNIQSLTIADSVETVEYCSFSGCSNLTVYGFADSCVESFLKEVFKEQIPFVRIDKINIDETNMDEIKESKIIETGSCGDNLTWTFDDTGTLTISGTGDMYNWHHSVGDPESNDTPWRSYLFGKSINNVIIEAGVTSIGNQAFYLVYDGPDDLDNSLVSISIPNSVTSIGTTAFCGCNNLKTIVIPDSVTSIGERAFTGCDSLTSIEIRNGVTSIGSKAFAGCRSLKEIKIPASVTSLEPDANSYTGISNGDGTFTIIPNYNQNDFGGTVFGNCTNLESITVDENNKMYSSDENGVLFNKDKTVLIKYPIGNKSTSYEIPDGVTIISRAAFEGCSNLEEIIIPEGVTSISNHAFADCTSLKEIIIPESVISVDYGAFEDCTNLERVNIGNSITNIDEDAFDGCTSLKNITVAENNELYSKDERGVLFNKDKTILIKYPVKTEGTSYEIPDGVTKIHDSAFKGCTSLEEVLIPDGVTSIGYSAFEDCTRLKAIVIPDSVTGIGDRAFYGCINLKSVKIGSRVTNIGGMYAFAFCKSLESIEIPESVTYVGQFSFMSCTNLKKVTVLSRNAEFSFGMDDVFERSNPIIYGYKGSTAETAAKNTISHLLLFPPPPQMQKYSSTARKLLLLHTTLAETITLSSVMLPWLLTAVKRISM